MYAVWSPETKILSLYFEDLYEPDSLRVPLTIEVECWDDAQYVTQKWADRYREIIRLDPLYLKEHYRWSKFVPKDYYKEDIPNADLPKLEGTVH